jgi:hypothetical protein
MTSIGSGAGSMVNVSAHGADKETAAINRRQDAERKEGFDVLTKMHISSLGKMDPLPGDSAGTQVNVLL